MQLGGMVVLLAGRLTTPDPTHLGVERFDELRLPLTMVATEKLTGHVRRSTHGPLVRALLASSALPGVFPYVSIDGCPLWDGGSVANEVPVAYLPRPCAQNWSLLDLDRSHELITPSPERLGRFLFEEDPPELGRMAGAPHDHGDQIDAVTLA